MRAVVPDNSRKIDWLSDRIKAIDLAKDGKTATCWASLFETPRLSPVGKPQTPIQDQQEALHIIASVKQISIAWKSLQTPSRVLTRGLTNNGNMCFLNSILQALVHCAPLANLFKILPLRLLEALETPYLLALYKLMLLPAIINAVDSFQPHSLNEISITPYDLLDCLRSSNTKSFQGDQEDAQEFFTFLLDRLDEEFLKNREIMNWEFTGLPAGTGPPQAGQDDHEGWQEVGKKQKISETRTMSRIETPISFLFYGQFRSTVKRPGVKESITFEPFNCLQLEVDHRGIGSLEDSLAFLTRPENIEGVAITRRLTIDKLPMVLVIQLKRFVYHVGHARIEKISKFVAYPERLILDRRVYHQSTLSMGLGQEPTLHQQPAYRLFAVVNHHGFIASDGHYTADVRKSFKQDESWYRLNDTIISRIPLERVLRDPADPQSTAYLLFYQRVKDVKV